MRKYFFLIAVLLPVVFADAQNVGIGTTSPKNKLHVAGGLRVDTLANEVVKVCCSTIKMALSPA